VAAKNKWIKGLSSAVLAGQLVGWLASLTFVMILPASCVSVSGIAAASVTAGISRARPKKSYTIDFCDGMDTCGVRFGTLLARMLLALLLWENRGSVCGKRGLGKKGGKGRALRRVSMNICRW
jgi:hypothetical protein